MKKHYTASDIAFNIIRLGLVAAIAITVICRFATNGSVTTISISDVSSAQSSAGNTVTSRSESCSVSDVNSGLININTATASQLTSLSGIGEKRAAAIVEYRELNGDFTSIEGLMNVSGIGEKIFEGIRDEITVGDIAVATTETSGAVLHTAEASSQEISAASAAGTSTSDQPRDNSRLININTATAGQLTELSGIGDVKAAAIVEYRARHGNFSSVDELLNVSGIGEKTLDNIRAYITVGSAAATGTQSTTAARAQADNSRLININTATAGQLTELSGIGDVKAAAIVEYRERHGNFSSVDELLNVSGIGEKTLDNIRAYITVGNTAATGTQSTTAARAQADNSRLININTATAGQLTELSGIGDVKAAAIAEYRTKHGNFSSVDELLNVSGISEKTLDNIRAYITV